MLRADAISRYDARTLLPIDAAARCRHASCQRRALRCYAA